MRKSNIRKIIATNRSRKAMPGMSAMTSSKVMGMGTGMPAVKPRKAMGQPTSIPGGIAAGMKKGGAAKKPKLGIAIMVAVGKKRGRG